MGTHGICMDALISEIILNFCSYFSFLSDTILD